MNRRTCLVAAIAAFVGLAAYPASTVFGASEAPKRERAVVSKMVSPTMFEMTGEGGRAVKVRLIGVASPGILQMMGASLGKNDGATRGWFNQAKETVGGRIKPGSAVTLEFDPYKRTWKGKTAHEMAYVWLSDGRMLNEWIIREGWGEASLSDKDRWRSDYVSMLRAAQEQARQANKGFWAHSGGNDKTARGSK